MPPFFTPLALFAIVITLATAFAIINHRYLHLPTTIGITAQALGVATVLLFLEQAMPMPRMDAARAVLDSINLPATLLDGALSFLLFAGAQSVDQRELWQNRFSILALALLGTLLAVALFAAGMWMAFPLVGLAVSLPWCVVLGAILAPTDPVSVVGMLRRLGLPPRVQAIFAGESLFNDGVGVVVFAVAVQLAEAGTIGPLGDVVWQLVQEVGGGLLLGFLCGCLAVWCIRLVTDAHLELLISISLASGVYSLAKMLEVSGPVAAVTAGLALGMPRALGALSQHGHREIRNFWMMVDEVLNACLFVLIGFYVLSVPIRVPVLLAAALAIPLSITVRALSVLLAMLPVYLRDSQRWRVLAIMTWGGLRGGISIALALSLEHGPMRDVLLAVCYAVVVFTILVQGLTMERVVRQVRLGAAEG